MVGDKEKIIAYAYYMDNFLLLLILVGPYSLNGNAAFPPFLAFLPMNNDKRDVFAMKIQNME